MTPENQQRLLEAYEICAEKGYDEIKELLISIIMGEMKRNHPVLRGKTDTDCINLRMNYEG